MRLNAVIMMKQFVNYTWFVAKGNALIANKKLFYYFHLILCFCFCSQPFVLVGFSVDVINAITKRKLGKKEVVFFLFLSHQLYIVNHQGQPRKRLQTGTQGQELNQSP